jgi:DNA-binding MarR family transcriptional regulator
MKYILMNESIPLLLADVSRLMRRSFDQRARSIGVTRAQWRVITMLVRHEGINQGGLADLIEVEPITLCRMVDRLTEASLVERRPDPNDRRVWRLFLTDKARALLSDLRLLAEDLNEEAMDGISGQEQEQLRTILDSIRANLSRRAQEVASG